MLVDLHVHNEGGVSEMFEYAKKIGLDGLGFTDGPDMAASEEIHELAEKTGLLGFCGSAIETNRGLLLCFFPNPKEVGAESWVEVGGEKPPVANDVVTAVEQRGGVAIAAHPYYKAIPLPMGDHIFSITGLHACEAASPLATGMQRDLAIEASDSLSLPCIGGSAARTSEHVGLATTFLPGVVESEADLCTMIRDKKCFALMALAELPRDARPSTPARPRYQDQRRRGRGRRPQRR